MMEERARRVALITGGSRGIGAEVARGCASAGYDVLLTYRNKATRAAEVVTELQDLGVEAQALASDVTLPSDRAALAAALRAWHGRLDLLILNASGGLERDKLAENPDYPYLINCTAQVALVEALLPLLVPGATIVFVTSHWAHAYGRVAQFDAYTPVAASKHAGEQALRAMEPELTAAGVRLLVVTGDLIEGTITPKLLERAASTTARAALATLTFPTAGEMGAVIVKAALDPALASGSTIVVGRALAELPPLSDQHPTPTIGARG